MSLPFAGGGIGGPSRATGTATRAANGKDLGPIFDFAKKQFLVWRGKCLPMQALHAFGTKGKSDASSIFATPMSDLFGVITPLQQHGGRRPGAGRPRKGEVRPPKRPSPPRTGSDYILGRLTRDAADGVRNAAILLEGISKNLISPWAAGVEMNYVRRREVTGRGSENMARARDWRLHRLFNPRPDPKAQK